jgi:hypothetical protein
VDELEDFCAIEVKIPPQGEKLEKAIKAGITLGFIAFPIQTKEELNEYLMSWMPKRIGDSFVDSTSSLEDFMGPFKNSKQSSAGKMACVKMLLDKRSGMTFHDKETFQLMFAQLAAWN